MDLYPNSWLLNFLDLSSGPSNISNSFSIIFDTVIRSDLIKVITLTPNRSSIVPNGFFWYFSSFKTFLKKLSKFFTRTCVGTWRIFCFFNSLSNISLILSPNFWKWGLISIYSILILLGSISILNSDLNFDKFHHLRLLL